MLTSNVGGRDIDRVARALNIFFLLWALIATGPLAVASKHHTINDRTPSFQSGSPVNLAIRPSSLTGLSVEAASQEPGRGRAQGTGTDLAAALQADHPDGRPGSSNDGPAVNSLAFVRDHQPALPRGPPSTMAG